MSKKSVPALNTEEFRMLLSKHRTVFVENLLGCHLFCLTHMLEGEEPPEVTLCEACDELVDLDLSRRGRNDCVSEKTLVAYWGSRVGAAIAAVMLAAHFKDEPNLDRPICPEDTVEIRPLDTPPPQC